MLALELAAGTLHRPETFAAMDIARLLLLAGSCISAIVVFKLNLRKPDPQPASADAND